MELIPLTVRLHITNISRLFLSFFLYLSHYALPWLFSWNLLIKVPLRQGTKTKLEYIVILYSYQRNETSRYNS